MTLHLKCALFGAMFCFCAQQLSAKIVHTGRLTGAKELTEAQRMQQEYSYDAFDFKVSCKFDENDGAWKDFEASDQVVYTAEAYTAPQLTADEKIVVLANEPQWKINLRYKINKQTKEATVLPMELRNATEGTGTSSDYFYSTYSLEKSTLAKYANYNTFELTIPEKFTYEDADDASFDGEYTVTTIGRMAFINAGNNTGEDKGSHLQTLTLPSTIRHIEPYAFAGCDYVDPNSDYTYLSILNNITDWGPGVYLRLDDANNEYMTFGEGVFANCSSLRKIRLPYTQPHIGTEVPEVSVPDAMFLNCSSLEWLKCHDDHYNPENITYPGYDLYPLTNNNASDNMRKYKTIGKASFAGCHLTMSALYPYLETLGEYAFYGAEVNSLTISSPNFTTIPKHCFEGSHITSLSFFSHEFFDPNNTDNTLTPEEKALFHEENLTTIGDYAFRNCNCFNFIEAHEAPTQGGYNLTHIATLGAESFKNSSVQFLYFSGPFTEIPYACFEDCWNLEYLEINHLFGERHTIEKICKNAFKNCTKLTEVHAGFADKGILVGESAFENCFSEGTNVTMGGILGDLGSTGEQNSFKRIRLLQKNAFKGCTYLKMNLDGITEEMNNVELNETFHLGDPAINGGMVTPTITHKGEIAEGTFENCRSAHVTEVKAKYIGARAFRGTINEEIVWSSDDIPTVGVLSLPNALEIGDEAFYDMQQTQYVDLSSITPPALGSGTDGLFKNFTDDVIVRVPLRGIGAYNDKQENGAYSFRCTGNNGTMSAQWQLGSKLNIYEEAGKRATLYCDAPVKMPEGTSAYYIKGNNTNEFQVTAKLLAQPKRTVGTDVQNADYIPTETPVLLSAQEAGEKLLLVYNKAYSDNYATDNADEPSNHQQKTYSEDNASTYAANLRGMLDPGKVPAGSEASKQYHYFKWTTDILTHQDPGFYGGNGYGAQFYMTNFNKAYLETSKAKGTSSSKQTTGALTMVFDDSEGQATSISGVTESQSTGNDRLYNLSGQRISNAEAGKIYIRNGKKVIAKSF